MKHNIVRGLFYDHKECTSFWLPLFVAYEVNILLCSPRYSTIILLIQVGYQLTKGNCIWLRFVRIPNYVCWWDKLVFKIRRDNATCVEDLLPQIQAKIQSLNPVFQQIDKLEVRRFVVRIFDVQGVHKVLHTLKIFISQKPHKVETLHFRQWIILP